MPVRRSLSTYENNGKEHLITQKKEEDYGILPSADLISY
jgi:hypothetical protein